MHHYTEAHLESIYSRCKKYIHAFDYLKYFKEAGMSNIDDESPDATEISIQQLNRQALDQVIA